MNIPLIKQSLTTSQARKGKKIIIKNLYGDRKVFICSLWVSYVGDRFNEEGWNAWAQRSISCFLSFNVCWCWQQKGYIYHNTPPPKMQQQTAKARNKQETHSLFHNLTHGRITVTSSIKKHSFPLRQHITPWPLLTQGPWPCGAHTSWNICTKKQCVHHLASHCCH